MTKELIEAIERLGNGLEFVSELATNIYNEIVEMEKIPLHQSNIWLIKSKLATASYYYTRFHSKFLGSQTNIDNI